MTGQHRYSIYAARASCVVALGSILIAGLWPFGSPPNNITWLTGRPGVRYGRHATLLSAGILPDRPTTPCTVELWIRPATDRGGTLLAFYGERGILGLSLHQSITDLLLRRGTGTLPKIYIPDILHSGKLAFLTVVSGPDGTSVYQNGALVSQTPGFSAPPHICSGRFVVGDFPTENDSWKGELRGLAIYRSRFTAGQASLDYRCWLSTGRPSEAVVGVPEALYLFDEKSGMRIRDYGSTHVDLVLPARYVVVRQTLLDSPWHAFRPNWDYVDDLLINIVGFVPFGLTLSAVLAPSRRMRGMLMMVVLAGLMVSLTIETLQSRLPTRDSDLTDVLTNTFGTWLGAALYPLWRKFVSGLPLTPSSSGRTPA